MHTPTLPEALQPPADFTVDLDQIWFDVCEELSDPSLRNRSHHNRKTYLVGCAGPLCKKAARDYNRRRHNTGCRVKWQILDPILLYFFEEAKSRIAAHEERLLLSLTGKNREGETMSTAG